ncbi:hypothetical protein MUJ63_10150 [Lachnospiraceae bacterium NSJ-143]|nr:hypothetical protein [Lachnospiraceae bacterium NSJ-143]
MPDYTKNYGLKKPKQTNYYNVDDFNENADLIDSKLKSLEDKVSNFSNLNLLINTNFINAVNQRGKAYYTGSEYTIDRWKCLTGGIVSHSANGLELDKTGSPYDICS